MKAYIPAIKAVDVFYTAFLSKSLSAAKKDITVSEVKI
jgi:hypothetical protein